MSPLTPFYHHGQPISKAVDAAVNTIGLFWIDLDRHPDHRLGLDLLLDLGLHLDS